MLWKGFKACFMWVFKNFKSTCNLLEKFFGISVPNYQVLWTVSFVRASAIGQDVKRTILQ